MKNNAHFLFCFFILIGFNTSIYAQDLLETLDKEFPDTPKYEMSTFKTTRIAIGHSIENRKKGVLEIRTMSRFWDIPNNDAGQSFFVDKISTRVSLEYGITDNLTFGAGGTTFDGIFDGFLKYKLVRQQKDTRKSPFSVTLFQNASYRSKRFRSIFTNINKTEEFSDKLAFTSQLLIAHKFNPKFSAQIAPTFVHRSSSAFGEDPNNQFAVSIGARHKLGGHVSIVSEYYYLINPLKSIDTYDAFALGINWELSDVMLQFHMTNARSIVEDAFITQTRNNFNFNDGNFHFGFNATFILHFKNKLKENH